jgi:hypothetical protein
MCNEVVNSSLTPIYQTTGVLYTEIDARAKAIETQVVVSSARKPMAHRGAPPMSHVLSSRLARGYGFLTSALISAGSSSSLGSTLSHSQAVMVIVMR